MRKMGINALLISLIINIFLLIPTVFAASEHCYSSGGVFGLIILSVFTTLFVIALTVALIWFLWTKNLLKLDFILKRIGNKKSETETKGDLESAKQDYAFDNPYFRDEEHDHKNSNRDQTDNKHLNRDTIILVEGKEVNKETVLEGINNRNHSERYSQEKPKNGQLINNRFVKSLPLSAVFNNVPLLHKKSKPENQKSLDDYYLREKPERLEVELIGRDFTGLGFNLCGNMRDGIFVKDVLNRGPAHDSTKFKAGDRIIGVNVSFEKMVFEDAVAILSYASPYQVKIELEKSAHYSTIERLTNNLNTTKNLSSNTDKSLLHPLYRCRSHSVDDLTQIAKEMSLSEKSTNSTNSGKNVIQKIKSQLLNKMNAKSVMTVDENLCKTHNFEEVEQKTENLKKFELKVDEQIVNVVTEEPQIETIDSKADHSDQVKEKDLSEDMVNKSQTEAEVNSDSIKELSENEVIKKPVVPAKRKGRAPQPPSDVLPQTVSLESISNNTANGETIETTAQVHNEEIPVLNIEDNVCQQNEVNNCDQLANNEESTDLLTSSSDSFGSEEQNTCEDSMRLHSTQRIQTSSPTGKPKSSSMSDLTNNIGDKLDTVLLERAVSLDMKGQSLPEENLNHLHAKNLLVLNDESADSMPIISWSLNKPTNSDSNSSESTLDEINQGFVYSNRLSESLNTIEVKSIDLSNNTNENEIQVLDESKYISNIIVEVPPITSTPIRTDQSSAIRPTDQFNQLDSSFSSSDTEVGEQTLIDKNGTDFPSDSHESQSESDLNLIQTNDKQIKEVIELSESELDDVMMSHKQFLIKQAKTNGSYPYISTTALKPTLIEPQLESLDFESWSYMSEDENSNLSKSQNEPTLYRTALDISLDNSLKKLPEVSGITLKTGENGQLTNTVFISTNDSHDSSFSSSSSSSPSK